MYYFFVPTLTVLAKCNDRHDFCISVKDDKNSNKDMNTYRIFVTKKNCISINVSGITFEKKLLVFAVCKILHTYITIAI